VAEEGHFGRAAERLHISTSRLSDLIRGLEREMGTTLLARTTRKVKVTMARPAPCGSAQRLRPSWAWYRASWSSSSGSFLIPVSRDTPDVAS
jgi:DNA-binding transcriptional LysR family regulator